MVEAFLSGLVLGLSVITILGLFVTAFLQFKRGSQINI
jgi:cytochrome b6-f complex subunit 5